MKRGFVLGKFMPLHRGHIFMFNVACSLVDELTILVCTRACEPIEGLLRLQWVKQSVKSNTRVLHLSRDIPQEPSEHPDFWSIWTDTIREFHPEPIDLVVGSDDYIVKLADVLSAQPFLLDRERKTVPVSASLIREDPSRYWDYVPAAVRPHYQKRFCILGPESTGKSTLAERLARHYQTRCIEEFGRTYDAVHRNGENWQDSDFIAVAVGHIAIRQETTKRAGPVVFEDTDLLQTLVWANYLLGYVPDGLVGLLNRWEPADRYLLMKPDVEWIDDGTRYSGDAAVRTWFFDELECVLQRQQLPYDIVSGDNWSDRAEAAQGVVSSLLVGSKTVTE